MNGVGPYAWLKTTLEKIAAGHPNSRIDDLLPWNFKPPSSCKPGASPAPLAVETPAGASGLASAGIIRFMPRGGFQSNPATRRRETVP